MNIPKKVLEQVESLPFEISCQVLRAVSDYINYSTFPEERMTRDAVEAFREVLTVLEPILRRRRRDAERRRRKKLMAAGLLPPDAETAPAPTSQPENPAPARDSSGQTKPSLPRQPNATYVEDPQVSETFRTLRKQSPPYPFVPAEVTGLNFDKTPLPAIDRKLSRVIKTSSSRAHVHKYLQ